MTLTALQKRLASAAVLLPVIVGDILVGHPLFEPVVAFFAGVMIWEWIHVCLAPRLRAGEARASRFAPRIGAFAAVVCALSAIAFGFGYLPPGQTALSVFAAAGIVFLPSLTLGWRAAAWFGLGCLYVLTPAYALMALRADPNNGLALVLWVLGLTIAADTLAFAAGRLIQGPKLAPRISPNKTWSGLGGAVFGAALASIVGGAFLNPNSIGTLTILGACLGVVEQAGDLVESAFKRHFGAKDSGRIIPGHGGVLDRVDGLLAVAVVVAAIDAWGGTSLLTGN